ncbi:hypothetical protein [Streptomyces cahuitamycinicus]|uniref:Uncharacterized protein n=1 Tax=Streptomyces cahuitamycinicus TaxID=2070367 RepID=A0A2N8TDB7_9ACTN|nr:hypothetical protein [Streptomyces cahuitamycinicus]PNG17012.1 hypothetical protein C1J00_38810 [Streptomyces cahuitamycinicus]
MITATQRAEAMAQQILISARLHNDRVVTHDEVDAVMSRDHDKEQGKANKEMVRRIIRKQAASEFVRVIFTEDERYWAIREQLHHMSADAVHALRDEITDGGDDDPRGWDKALTNAISVRLSNRPIPARLWGCKPVSIRLWREPRPRPAADERPATDERKHVRIVNGGTRHVIPTRDALTEINAAMMQPLVKRQVREMSAARSSARIVYKDERGTVVLRPATEEEIAAADRRTAATPFAALAAYEAATHAALGSAPRDLADLARHLFTLGKFAPPEHHLEIVETHSAVEEAWDALRRARCLIDRNAAHDKARAAVERAREAIVAVASRAHRMHGTDLPGTAEEIRNAALGYNAVDATSEELSAVTTGTPTVRVHCRSDSGTGWTVTATITAGVDSPIGHIPAHPPIALTFRKRDGRHDAAENTRRMFGRLFRVDVPVTYDLDPRP